MKRYKKEFKEDVYYSERIKIANTISDLIQTVYENSFSIDDVRYNLRNIFNVVASNLSHNMRDSHAVLPLIYKTKF